MSYSPLDFAPVAQTCPFIALLFMFLRQSVSPVSESESSESVQPASQAASPSCVHGYLFLELTAYLFV